jgi:tellurite methyltransferase
LSLEQWNQRYLAGEQLSEKPAALVQRFAGSLTPGRALDLACGPGRHALYLAERGWRVTAVDGSPIAIEHLRERAHAKQLDIDARVTDLERGEFEIPAAAFDLLVVFRYWQRDLIPAIQRGVLPGGTIIAVARLTGPDQPRGSPTRAAPGELRAFFAGWKILHYNEGGDPQHAVAELVAMKPQREFR